MAKRSKTHDDAQPNRSAPAFDGMAGGLLSGAMLAGAVAGAVEHSLAPQGAEGPPAGPVGTARAADGGAGDAQPARLPFPAPGAPEVGPANAPHMEAAPTQGEPAPTLTSAAPSQAGPGATGAQAAPRPEAAPSTFVESTAARPDVTATPAAPTSSVAEQVEPAAIAPAVDLAAVPAGLSPLVDQVAGDLTQDLTALTDAVTAELSSLIAMPAITTEPGSALEAPTKAVADLAAALDTQLAGLPTAAELAPALMGPVAEVAALAETVAAIPATLLGAESLDVPLSPLSIALGAEANTAPHLSVTLPGVTADMGVEIAAEVEAGILDLGGLDGGGALAISFAGLSYLDSPEIDGGTTGGNAGLFHGLI
ncbi:MAG: hypothetical protein ACT6XY_05230 [Phreatobacter sp.]|uniref:hypothetical protein n=1 Tax=Phreatobacter sp. TaxID=1966341 RepID=UPI0040350141